MIARRLVLRSGVSGGSPCTPTPLKHGHGICQLLLADATSVIQIKVLQATTTQHWGGEGRGGGVKGEFDVKEGGCCAGRSEGLSQEVLEGKGSGSKGLM